MDAKKIPSKIIYIFLSYVIYPVAFFLLLPIVGERISILILIPLLTTASFSGIRGGLFSAVILIPINLFFLYLGGYPSIFILMHSIPQVLGAFIISGIVGSLSDLNKKYKSQLKLLANEVEKRKKAENDIKESEKKYRNVVESIKEVIFQTDIEGNLTFLNPAWSEITGYSIEESIGKNFLDFVDVKDVEKYVKDFKSLINNEKEYFRHVLRYKSRNGELKWIEVYVRLSFCDSNVIGGISGNLRDITENKKAEEEIKASLEKEKELNDLKSKFVSTVSHEFRTPLTSILASIELMQRYYYKWNDEKKLSILYRIERSIEYMNEMISDVLIINRSDSGRTEFKPAPIDLVELSRDIFEEVKLSALPSHKFELNYDIKCKKVNADEKLLREIIGNLLSNSIKYSPKGGNIILSIRKNGGIEISIKDEGIGISDVDQEKLFQPFFRGENIENIPGTGLGLSILQRAVQLHKGNISFKSKLGKGTSFVIKLPEL